MNVLYLILFSLYDRYANLWYHTDKEKQIGIRLIRHPTVIKTT